MQNKSIVCFLAVRHFLKNDETELNVWDECVYKEEKNSKYQIKVYFTFTLLYSKGFFKMCTWYLEASYTQPQVRWSCVTFDVLKVSQKQNPKDKKNLVNSEIWIVYPKWQPWNRF